MGYDYTKVLKRAWHMVWRYRALWVFGVVLALTTTSWPATTLYDRDDDRGGGSLIYVLPNGSSVEVPGRDEGDEGGDLVFNYKHQADGRSYHQGDVIVSYDPPSEVSIEVVSRDQGGHLRLEKLDVRPGAVGAIVGLGIALACLIVLLIVAASVARYVGETALIRMVDAYERTGERRSVWQGVRMGWSRAAWRFFAIDLLIGVSAALAFTLLFAAMAVPLLLAIEGGTAALSIGVVFTSGLFFLAVFLAIVVGTALSLLKRLARRACALEGLGVMASIRRGVAIVRQNLKEVGLTWLIMAGLHLGWPMAMVPIVFLLLSAGALLGGLPALLAYGLAGLASGGETPLFVALAVGIPLFLLVLVVPLVFLGGLREVFVSSTWTMAYRELRSVEGLEPRPLPESDASGLEAAPIA